MPVDIVSLDYDFWYSMAKADDQLDPDETPTPLNEQGVLYYYRFRRAGELATPTWPDSGGYPFLKDAMLAAQEKAPSPIDWD